LRFTLNNCALLCDAGCTATHGGDTMKLLQIVPRDSRRLYDAMVKKQADIRRRGRGTFLRSGAKRKNAAKWTHAKFKGTVDLSRSSTDLVAVKIKSRVDIDESKLLSAFLGWIDRHFGDQLRIVTIQYR
jgi:hypothetical protein